MIKESFRYTQVKVFSRNCAIIFIAFFCSISLYAQEAAEATLLYSYFDSQYGLNPTLYRGRKYINLTKYSAGNPFFTSEEMEAQKRRDAFINKESNSKNNAINFSQGRIRVDNQLYSQVLLSYDVYMQEVIIQSISASGLSNALIIPNSRIDEYWIGEHHFVKNPHEEIDALFVEKIESEYTEVVCYLSYTKEYRLQQDAGKGEMGFGELRAKKYLYSNQSITRFRGKSRFLKGLRQKDKEKVIKYVKSHPNKFKNGDSLYFKSLLDSLYGKTNDDDV